MTRGHDLKVAQANRPAEEAMRLHPLYRGKVQMMPKCPIRGIDDFAIWYTPGVAAVCEAIRREPDSSYELTNRANTIGIISDGTRVLGLGNIGPLAGMPVMEGKALLFKYLGGVDAIPLCVETGSPEALISVARALAPSFGGINLEDISQPSCFRVLDTLRDELSIPVWHDDQQGTATVVLGALMAALEVVGKRLGEVRIGLIGMGAANVATYRLLREMGVEATGVVGCDSRGILHRSRDDIALKRESYADKWRICEETNGEGRRGGIEDALRGADVCIAFSRSGPETIRPEWVKGMASDAIVFACANPIPEIWPWLAEEAGARVVATGRSDFANQVNNSLCFPGIFRGALDVRASRITDSMAIAAAKELVECARVGGLSERRIVPRMDEWDLHHRIAFATAIAARQAGVNRLTFDNQALWQSIEARLAKSRADCDLVMSRLGASTTIDSATDPKRS
jgi:malate dehydrogenase (oxaloacetate-decarboxylating)